MRSTEAAPGEPRLASAVDASLLDALKKAFEGRKAKLVSIQPALMSRFNAWRSEMPKSGAWLVLAEAERACIALHGARGWRAVQSTKGEWRSALERERHRVEGEVPSLVLISGAAAPSNELQWQFREIGP